ncbi:unnamed protein product [Brassica rapa subsp. trilocularis]
MSELNALLWYIESLKKSSDWSVDYVKPERNRAALSIANMWRPVAISG